MAPNRVEKARSFAGLELPRLLALVSSLGALLTFCTADSEPANAGQPAGARVPLTIGVTGCSVLRVGHVCELSGHENHELTFWFPDAQVDEQPTMTLGGRDVECSPGKRLEGEGGNTEAGVLVSCRLQTDAAGGQLQFELKGRINTLQLEVAPRWHWQDELARLANPEAIERLGALLPKTKDAERGRVLSALAVRQTAVGEWRAACDTLEQAATIAAGLGRHSESRHRWLVCAYQASEHYDFELARRAIGQAAEHPGGDEAIVDVEREAFVDYAWSFFHTKLGEYDKAEAAYARTIAWSRRGASELGERSAVGLAHLAAERGRYAEATSILVGASDGPLARRSPCFRATALHNLGRQELNAHWAKVDPRLGSEPWLTRAEAHLQQAAALVAGPCTTASASDKAWILLELGFVAWHHHELVAARRFWTQAGPADQDGYYWAWRTILEAELALEGGDYDKALTEFGRLASFGETTLRLPIQWTAVEGLARVHAVGNRWPLAIEHFRRAEEILTASERDIPVEHGLLGFTSGKIRSARGLVSALVHEGEVREAFAAARVARRRVLSAADVAARDAAPHGWGSVEEQQARGSYLRSREALTESVRRLNVAPMTEVASIERQVARERVNQRAALAQLLNFHRGRGSQSTPSVLRAPDPDEVQLLWFEADDAWHGFAQSDEALVHVTAQEPSGSDWLLPLNSITTRRQRLTILGFGRFQGVPVHTLAFEGEALFERFDVAYGLDLEARASPGSSAPRDSRAQRVFIAADARGDLPLAAAEATRLQSLYQRRGTSVVSLTGVGLRAPAFRSAIDAATVLHFAGHGGLAGSEGWDSWLELAGDTRLTAGDILALPRVPSIVVLNACEAGANRDLARGPGLGLAHAWVLAGAETVVAPTQPVPDRDAARFALSFGDAFVESGDVAQAYRAALRDPHVSDTLRASYRVLRR